MLDGMNVDSLEEKSKEGDAQDDAKSQAEKIDPEDPLYGIDERLKYTKLDDDTKLVIKQKLIEAQEKVKDQLEQRQNNLADKLVAGGKKK